MTLADIPYLAKRAGPEWLPAAAAQGRQFSLWGQLALLFMTAVLLIAGIASIFSRGYSIGAYALIAGIVNLLIYAMMPNTVFAPLDQGRFREASDRLLLVDMDPTNTQQTPQPRQTAWTRPSSSMTAISRTT